MAVIENDVLMKFKDSSGNINLLYPITKADDVDGLQEAIRNQGVVTEGTGAVYTATVEGITSLSAGVSFVMIPHTVSAHSSPKLNVNGLGEKFIRRRVSGSTTTTYSTKTSDDWLASGKPIRVMYDGTQWIADMPVPYANDIMGAVPIANGGTGATTVAAARNALGLGNTSGAVPIANGGTGATTATQARINLGIETTDGTVISGNANYAEVGEWVDGNPDAEDRIGYFVCVDNTTAKMAMRKATEIDDVRGVTITAPAFSGNCSNDKFDSDGNLIAKYSFVAVMGNASVIDNGTCTVNGRCMPTNDGTAIPSPNSMGYQVISRIDATHVLIMVEPQADMLVRIKNDVTQKANLPKTASGTVIALSDASDGPLQDLRIYGRTTQDGTPTPEAPVELVSVGDGGSVEVTICGKNLYDASLYPLVDNMAISSSDGTVYATSSKKWCATLEYIPVPKSLIGKSIVKSDSATVCFYDNDKIFLRSFATGTYPFIVPENSAYYRFDMLAENKNTAQIALESTQTGYEPYTAQTLPISTPNGLPGIPVTSGGNYTDADGQQWICDEVDFARGVYVQRIQSITLTGSEVIKQFSNVTGAFQLDVLGGVHIPDYVKVPTNIMCNYYQPRARKSLAEKTEIGVGIASKNWLIIYDDTLSTATMLKDKLAELYDAGNPVKVLVILGTPVETPIPEDELAAYAALHTNRPNTTVYNDAGAYMEVGYYPPDATMRQEDIRAYVDGKRFTVSATITTGWTGDSAPYYNTVEVPGILAVDTPHITPVHTNTDTVMAEKEAWGMVTYAVSGDGSITFVCYEDKPATAIPIQIEVMR